ncbi:MAG TPA: heavy metal-binding domain-containing protein, partial [Polyangiaceae bacterium]
ALLAASQSTPDEVASGSPRTPMSLFGKSAQQPAAPPAPSNEFHFSDAGKRRIAELRGADGRGGLFTSDLSINEFAMVERAGFQPLGLVMASSVYHVGYQAENYNVSQELTVLSQAMYAARELAMERMEVEADALGADGVVGVRLNVSRYEFSESLMEFVAVGTAVRHKGGGPFRTAQGKPFTSDLSGQDFAVLLSTGYRPVGLVMGTCVYHIAHQTFRQFMAQNDLASFEMGSFTQALYDARELAMERMQEEAKDLGALGIVGARLTEESQGWDAHVIEYLALGTAIVKLEGAPPEIPVVLPLSDAPDPPGT